MNCSALSCAVSSAPPPLPLSQEGDDYEVIPNSKFYVSRTANKDNSSSYYINGNKAKFKEVGALLRSHGIDLDHNRFLILQVIVIYFYIISLCTLKKRKRSSLLWPSHSVRYSLPFVLCPVLFGLNVSWLPFKAMPVCGSNLLHWNWKEEEVPSALDCYSSASWFETMWKGANHYLLL